MPAPVPYPLRLAIARRQQHGQSSAAIAQILGVSVRTVRHLVARYRANGESALLPDYRRSDLPPGQTDHQLRDQALGLRRDHPTWGAGLIRLQLRRRGCRGPLPTERTLQRWFHQAGLGPAPKGRRPATVAGGGRAKRPHDVWQIDAKEQIRLRDGQRVSWLRVVDECSGAVLWTKVFPPGPLAASSADVRTGRIAAGFCPLGEAKHHPRR